MANTGRNQKYLGIDSNVLVAYLVPEHPDHDLTKPLRKRKHAVNPTVLHETFHTCVFKLRRKPEETVRALLQYMNSSMCIPMNSATVNLGLKLALKHHLGGRDTVVNAAKIVKDNGAKRVFVACVHPLLIADAERRILDAGVEEIVGTDSVPSWVSKVTLAPLISNELTTT